MPALKLTSTNVENFLVEGMEGVREEKNTFLSVDKLNPKVTLHFI